MAEHMLVSCKEIIFFGSTFSSLFFATNIQNRNIPAATRCFRKRLHPKLVQKVDPKLIELSLLSICSDALKGNQSILGNYSYSSLLRPARKHRIVNATDQCYMY